MFPLSKAFLFTKSTWSAEMYFALVNLVYQEVYMEDYVPSRNTKDFVANNCSNEYHYQAHMLKILKEWNV